ncbi:hypothetical protein Syun_018148 [Stephania yunnanensis]|uniref:Protein kinase domain-containing protein n=1 Tax=Stephania yunnanensis TaxID=152371 RepID=A0AAP0IRT1_9MAGN
MATYVDPPNGVRSQGKHYYSMWQTLFEIDTKYVPIKPIGRGAYGIVCSSLNRETHEKVAIKKINNAFENRVDALRTLRELKLLRHLRHENVIGLKDVMMPSQRKGFKDVYLVYELMDTDLHQIIKSSQALSNDHCQYFLFQLPVIRRNELNKVLYTILFVKEFGWVLLILENNLGTKNHRKLVAKEVTDYENKLYTRMRLWEFADQYVIEPTDGNSGSSLSISRVDGSMKLIGVYVTVITERECMGSYMGHPIFKVSSLKILPCDHSLKNSPAELKKMETEISVLLNAAERTTGLYFSYDVNLTLSLE